MRLRRSCLQPSWLGTADHVIEGILPAALLAQHSRSKKSNQRGGSHRLTGSAPLPPWDLDFAPASCDQHHTVRRKFSHRIYTGSWGASHSASPILFRIIMQDPNRSRSVLSLSTPALPVLNLLAGARASPPARAEVPARGLGLLDLSRCCSGSSGAPRAPFSGAGHALLVSLLIFNVCN